MSILAVITARGGSKRIPKKNIKDFFGKPMLAYAVEAAKKSKLFDEIMVSTDCPEIAGIAKKNGAKVPFMRSARTADDFATTFDVLEEVINEYKKQGQEFDCVCCIYPCVPFLTAETLTKAYEQMLDNKVDAIMPVCKYPAPVEWALRFEKSLLVPCSPEKLKVRSQDLCPAYFDAGMFYFCNIEVLLKERSLVPNKVSGYIINEEECQDIDTLEDWKMAELKFGILGGKNVKF